MSTDNSPVSICSNALLMLGAQPINDFNENNDRARLAANLYPSVRDALLREHPWNCAIKRVLLAPDAIKPVFDYQHSFTLPADYLRVLSVVDNANFYIDYKIESRQIVANASSIKLRYIFQNEDITTYDSELVNLLELAMASKLAYAITQSSSLAQFRLQEYQLALKSAKAINGQEYPPQTFGESELLIRRLHG